MLTLCIDTAYKYLTCAVIRNGEILASYSKECFKRQSEEVFNALELVFAQAQVSRTDIDSICITKGPGSYTGVRIAMTIAKVIGETLHCSIYTISTLRLYAAGRKSTMVVMDARAQRAYVGIYDGDDVVMKDQVLPISEIKHESLNLVGDGALFGRETDFGNIPEAFLKTRHLWEKANNIAYLTPEYLKESESYLK